MKIGQSQEITFDDVLLLPKHAGFPLSRENQISLKTSITRTINLDIPILSSPMPGVTESSMAIKIAQLGGIGVIHPFQEFDRQLRDVEKVKKNNLRVGASVADFSTNGLLHCGNLIRIGVDFISLESAHADNTETLLFIKKLKKKYPHVIISAAHVVTGEATRALIQAGVDSVRVGIGGGSHCTTRIVTGVGRPQLSAVIECAKVARRYDIPIISDSGIKYAGDIPKALAAGASAVMIGGLFAGTDESPGNLTHRDGKYFKMSWGACTDTAMQQRQLETRGAKIITRAKMMIKRALGYATDESVPAKLFEEGVENLIPYRGRVNPIIMNLVAAVRRSFWYIGAKNIVELRRNAYFVQISNNTKLENLPRI